MSEIAQVKITSDEQKVLVTAGGTLDLTNSAEFHEGLKQASTTADEVTVDIRTADFIDTQVVQDLAKGAVTLLKRGKRLKLICAKTSCARG